MLLYQCSLGSSSVGPRSLPSVMIQCRGAPPPRLPPPPPPPSRPPPAPRPASAGGALLGRPRIPLRVQAPGEEPALAVLPFRNLSGEPELEIVSSDITAAVAEAVALTGRASIVPREKTLGFELDRGGIEDAGRSPGADYVLAGSLDENGGRIQAD